MPKKSVIKHEEDSGAAVIPDKTFMCDQDQEELQEDIMRLKELMKGNVMEAELDE